MDEAGLRAVVPHRQNVEAHPSDLSFDERARRCGNEPRATESSSGEAETGSPGNDGAPGKRGRETSNRRMVTAERPRETGRAPRSP